MARNSGQEEEFDVLASYIFGRPLESEERAFFAELGYGQPLDQRRSQPLAEAVALMIASPAFQWN
jgi:hypothetical protein